MTIKRVFLSILLVVSLTSGWHSHAGTALPPERLKPFEFLALNPKTLAGVRSIPPVAALHSANEKRVIQVIKAVSVGDLVKATRLAQTLTRTSPNYALAHLLYADLLRLHTPQHEPPLTPESHLNNQQFISQTLASNLPQINAGQLEMGLRFKALHSMPAPGMVPSHLLSMGNQYRQLVVADTQLGRLHIFDIRHSVKQPRFVLKHSFFMTIGDQGPGKQIEGDKKTPLGIYQLLDRIPQDILTDLYGSGALNINYPNPVDRRLGRTGFGIWFHGSPSNAYVRYPFSSDGCLVLSNDDMNAMLSAATPQQTLVIIDDGVDWKPSTELINTTQTSDHPVHHKLALLYEDAAIQSTDFNPEAFYEGGAKREYRLLRLIQSSKAIEKALMTRNITLLEWKRETPYTMVEFDFQLNSDSNFHRVRQYWMEKDGEWKIVRETIL
jgi:murein L,D-transpeptidase YafK